LQSTMTLDLRDPSHWSLLSGAEPPYGALGSIGAYDGGNHRVLSFGGTSALDAPGGEIDHTLDLDLATSTWRTREGPEASTEGACVVDSASGFLFQHGGSIAGGKSDQLSILVLGDHPYWL